MSAPPARDFTRVPYKGEDRRRIAAPVQSPFGRPYFLALTLVGMTAVLLIFVVKVPVLRQPQMEQLRPLLQVASFMVALTVGGLAIGRWYLTSDAPALWIGFALLFFGIVRLAAAEIAPIFLAGELARWADWLRPASDVLVVALFTRAATIVPVSPTISGRRLIAGTLAALAVLVLMMWLLPPLAAFIDGGAATQSSARGVSSGLSAALAAVAAVFTLQGHRRARWLFTWVGVMLFALSVGVLIPMLARPPAAAAVLGNDVLRLMGLLMALNGATREILHTYRDSSQRLARSEYTAMTAQERIREGQAVAEERAHEARSALAAVEGATRTLEHYRDRLPPETRAALSTAISGEIRRLQNLVSVEQRPDGVAPFSLAEALAPIVASERARGADLDVRVAGDLDVIGRAASTEQVLQSLFDNARRHAPGTRLTIRAERDQGWIVLRVEDRGPGVPTDMREAIFRRGVRGDAAATVPGSGLGLYVAAQLMKDQEGELWVDERRGGGASFAIALHAADPATGHWNDSARELQQSDQPAKEDGLSVARGD